MEIPKSDLDESRPKPIDWQSYVEWAEPQWTDLLASGGQEHEFQSFLERNPALLPGVEEYGSGHHSPHASVLFTQPRLQGLGNKQYPDFMWIGATSDTVTPVLIEIERPTKRWFTQSGHFTQAFHQAHGQLADWQSWFRNPENQLTFRKTYLDWIWNFSDRDIVPHYILVYGRRSEFADDHTGELKRRRVSEKRPNEEFMSFDRLQFSERLSEVTTVHLDTSGRLNVRAIQPCFTTGPGTGELALRSESPAEAIQTVPLWDAGCKKHVLERWHHWESLERTSSIGPRTLGNGE